MFSVYVERRIVLKKRSHICNSPSSDRDLWELRCYVARLLPFFCAWRAQLFDELLALAWRRLRSHFPYLWITPRTDVYAARISTREEGNSKNTQSHLETTKTLIPLPMQIARVEKGRKIKTPTRSSASPEQVSLAYFF